MASDVERKLSAYNDVALLLARILIAILFLIAAYNKFKGLGGSTAYFTKLGVPGASVMAPLAAAFELAAGILLCRLQDAAGRARDRRVRHHRGAARAHQLRRRKSAQSLPEELRDRRRLPRVVCHRAPA